MEVNGITRRRKASQNKHKYVEVALPEYMASTELASLLKTTLRQLSKTAARTFDWWPNTTARGMKKGGFSDVKDIIFSYSDAARLAEVFHRMPTPRNLQKEEETWATSRPFGAPNVVARPPVLAIMGHKDHGKTTLLDRLRGGNIAAKEEFGITQETYAFDVSIEDPKPAKPSPTSKDKKPLGPKKYAFSFLDTPGHVSFTDMRTNVANASDLILLVVAADEGVLDQTFETLRTARQLNRPLVVIINKMDLPNARANADRIKAELQELGAKLHTPDQPYVSLQGDLVVLEMSALRDETNLAQLRSVLLAVTKQLKPKADLNAVPRGQVIESMLARGRGNVLRVVLTEGELRIGQHFTADGLFEGRIKELRTMRGSFGSASESVQVSGPGRTIDVTGCVALPNPGTPFVVASSAKQAELMAKTKRNSIRYQDQQRVIEAEAMADQDQDGDMTTRAFERHPDRDYEDEEGEHDYDEDGDPDEDGMEDADEDFDEIEDVDEIDQVKAGRATDAGADYAMQADDGEYVDGEDLAAVDDDDDSAPIRAEDVPIDLDPRSRVAPPLPPRSSWELSPPPPPTQRSLPLANLRPKFKFYSLVPDQMTTEAEANARNAAAAIVAPSSEKRAGLSILIKTQNMGALNMIRHAIEEMNQRNAERGIPEIHVAYGAAGDLTKKDLVNAEAEGCWVYGFRSEEQTYETWE